MRWARRAAYELFHSVVRRDGMPSEWRRAESYQWLPTDSQASIQAERLRALVRHAVEQVPYYREVGNRIDDPIELARTFPILDKTLIRTNFDRLQAQDIPDTRRHANATSGSTGESLRFFVDLGSKPHRAAATNRFLQWCGVTPFDRRAKLWGARFDELRK